ncbi:MAG: phosphoribosylaminoimidazolesuccinocarboxamide synthase [Bacteroidetes bacterium]|nr:phosphoribosylaminoimidazolesuccinocarboxamide synthase [Bacteroidota bacterium]
MNTIVQTNFSFPGQTNFYKGKVRDVYTVSDELLVMVVSDRISAFDVVLPHGIPYKGQVLNQIAAKFMAATAHIIPNWVIDVPDPVVTVGHICKPVKVEMVIRGYLSGHAWREYKSGKRTICGEKMIDGMRENDAFPNPIITPTTKASVGHDEDISKDEIFKSKLIAADDYEYLEDITHRLYKCGTEMAAQQGLLLVDTKYEFGMKEEKYFLIDEIHTPDSSRYFYMDGYEERQRKGEPQKQLSKEFVREWLMANGFQGIEGQKVPVMSDEFVESVSERYIELYEKITGEKFVRSDNNNALLRVESNINRFLKNFNMEIREIKV